MGKRVMGMVTLQKCNNNIILASDGEREVIALGKGIGFNARPGEEVDASRIEKVFVPQETAQISRFKDILADLPYEIVLLAGKIVDCGKARLRRNFNQSIVIALADHLNFALSRIKDGMEIELPMIWDIKHIYPLEYAMSRQLLVTIKEDTGIELPEAEATAIALHFINAESDYPDMPNTIRMSKIIKKSIEIVEAHYKTTLDDSVPDFNGFVSLLRSTIMRFLYDKDEKQVKNDMELHTLLRRRNASEFDCAEKIAAFIGNEYNWQLSMNDVSFLALYIQRITEYGDSEL
ncbi:MAG: PRD domain-containing protein [Treponema sp.]|nr:PRD domain-containing protein [Treponema sp.]